MKGNLSMFWLIRGSASPILQMLHRFRDVVRLLTAMSVYVYESLFEKYRQRIHTAIYTHCLTSETICLLR